MILVEGNIGAGKSTLLTHVFEPLRKLLEGSDDSGDETRLRLVAEPVHRWQAPGSGSVHGGAVAAADLNLLEAAYSDPRRYAFTMQTYAVATRVDALLHAIARARGSGVRTLVLLCERSVYSDACVFARAALLRGSLTALEYRVYRDIHVSLTRVLDARDVALIVYVDTPPDACAANMRSRQRHEERAVDDAYLRLLHRLHSERLDGTAAAAEDIGQWPSGVPVLTLHAGQLAGVTTDARLQDARARDIYQALSAAASCSHSAE